MTHRVPSARCTRRCPFGFLCPLPLLLIPFFFGCGPDSSNENSRREVSEFMAGDTLVRMVGDPVHPGMAELDRELTIGMVEGAEEYTFSQISEALPFADGSILVHDGATSLKHFDSEGRFLRYFGRVGDGPGEFRQPSGIAQLPDGRILIGDTGNRRINVYSPEGEGVDTWILGGSYGTILNAPGNLFADTAGRVFLRFTDRMDIGLGPERSRKILEVRSMGEIVDTLLPPRLPDLTQEGRVWKLRPNPGGSTTRIGFLAPFYPSSMWTFSPLGYFITGRSDRYAVDLRISAGSFHPPGDSAGPGYRVISIRRTVDPVRLTRSERGDQADFLRARLDRIDGPLEGRIPPIPEAKPYFNRVMVGREGRIWVQIHTPSKQRDREARRLSEELGRPVINWKEPTVFDVFEPDGTFLGQVPAPEGVWVMGMFGDVVWGLTLDQWDVPYLHRYRIRWR